ncbi:MAG: hypothetical protein KJ574_01660 [Nanoarchaeota archaeon]|nr:hypothetical protein [Nanoarchaeota archaeon]
MESKISDYAGSINTLTSYSSGSVSYNVANTQQYVPVINLDAKPEFIAQYMGSSDKKMNSYSNYLENKNNKSYMLSPNYQSLTTQMLLKPGRDMTPVVGNADEIMHYITETFEKTAGEKMPKNIVIRICSEDELAQRHVELGGSWNQGILGFAINNNPGTNMIFVKENNMDALMLTIGHEIGHVMTAKLPDPRDEEAKAFAFELAWMDTLKEHNIANLADQFVAFIEPAKNGLHNVAFEFVISMLKRGKQALDVFKELFTREISIRNADFDD